MSFARLPEIIHLLQNFSQEYAEIFELKVSGEKLASVEQDRLKVTSCKVDVYIVDSWKIRSFVSDAVLYQLEPTLAVLNGSHLVKLINLASHLSTAGTTLDNSLLIPVDFIQVAEDTGLIVQLDEWTPTRVCEDVSRWLD